MSDIQSLTVAVLPSPETLVIVDVALLEKINELSAQAQALSVITSDIENEAAGNLLKLATALEKQVDENATAANKPFHEVSKAISAAKATASKPLASIKAAIKNSLTQFILKRDRERAEADAAAARKRMEDQIEIDRINAARAAEVAAINEAQAKEAAAANLPPPVPTPPPAPIVAPVDQAIVARPAAAKTDNTKVTRKMVCRIVDAGAVPRAYCIPDLASIEAAYKRGEITPEFHPFFVVEEVVSVSSK